MGSTYMQNYELEQAKLINFVFLPEEKSEMIRRWRNHGNIRRWMYMDHIISVEEHHDFLGKIEKDDSNYYWLVEKNDTYIGVVSINRLNLKNKNAYFVIYANPEAQIAGAGMLLDKVALELAFDVMGLHTLKAEVLKTNTSAIMVHKMMGFQEEGRLEEFILKDNSWQDVIIMGKTNK